MFDSTARHVVYVKGRRAGGTHGAVHRLVEIAMEERGSRHLWVDTVYRNIERYLHRYFFPALKHTRYRWSRAEGTLWFEGGSRCDFGTVTRPENMEGFGYDYFWINEAGIVLKDPAIFYNTLLPMAAEAEEARMFFIGAPKGPGLFRQMYDWGQDDQRPDWASFRHTSHDNPMLSAEALRVLRENMPERNYRQEVLAEFVASDGAVFRDVTGMATAAPQSAPAPGCRYAIGVDLARQGNIRLLPQSDGTLNTYVSRMSVGPRADRYRNFDPDELE